MKQSNGSARLRFLFSLSLILAWDRALCQIISKVAVGCLSVRQMHIIGLDCPNNIILDSIDFVAYIGPNCSNPICCNKYEKIGSVQETLTLPSGDSALGSLKTLKICSLNHQKCTVLFKPSSFPRRQPDVLRFNYRCAPDEKLVALCSQETNPGSSSIFLHHNFQMSGRQPNCQCFVMNEDCNGRIEAKVVSFSDTGGCSLDLRDGNVGIHSSCGDPVQLSENALLTSHSFYITVTFSSMHSSFAIEMKGLNGTNVKVKCGQTQPSNVAGLCSTTPATSSTITTHSSTSSSSLTTPTTTATTTTTTAATSTATSTATTAKPTTTIHTTTTKSTTAKQTTNTANSASSTTTPTTTSFIVRSTVLITTTPTATSSTVRSTVIVTTVTTTLTSATSTTTNAGKTTFVSSTKPHETTLNKKTTPTPPSSTASSSSSKTSAPQSTVASKTRVPTSTSRHPEGKNQTATHAPQTGSNMLVIYIAVAVVVVVLGVALVTVVVVKKYLLNKRKQHMAVFPERDCTVDNARTIFAKERLLI